MKYSFLAMLLPITAYAADPAAAPAGSIFQVLFGLVAVLGLMIGVAWLLKRTGAIRPFSNSAIKVVGGINIGHRERILIVEVADQWIVVGVTPGKLRTLATMPRQENTSSAEILANATNVPNQAHPNFSAWLKKMIEKRHG